MLTYIIIYGLFGLVTGATTFWLDSEGWTIVGNKGLSEEAKHQPYSMGPQMSNYILGTDNLVNVDSKNRDDRNLWYFRSPPITLLFKPAIMVFTITSFSGDFTKLNKGVSIVRMNNAAISFDKVGFNGELQTITVPFFEEMWKSDAKFSFKTLFQNPFTIEILGDWTRGVETIAIDNIEFY